MKNCHEACALLLFTELCIESSAVLLTGFLDGFVSVPSLDAHMTEPYLLSARPACEAMQLARLPNS